MPVLTTDVMTTVSAKIPSTLAQVHSAIDATFYRGSLVHALIGLATPRPALNAYFIGFSWGRVNAKVGDLVLIAISGRFLVQTPNAVASNLGEVFAMNTELSDNPADLDLIDFGSAGPAGTMDQVAEDGVSRWLNIDRR